MRAVKCIKLPEKDPPIWDDGVSATDLFTVGRIYVEKYITFGTNGSHGSIIGIVADWEAQRQAHIFTIDYLLKNFPDSFVEVTHDPSTT